MTDLSVVGPRPSLAMSLHSVGFSFDEMLRLAQAVAASGLFGIRTPDQALTLMFISQAEGRHPALAARDYDIIQGKPAKKAEAMQRDFLSAGGQMKWNSLNDTGGSATFSHPIGGAVTIEWDVERAQKAGLWGKDMWKKFPRQMFRSRIVSEGVRTVFPAATSGMYVPEEAHDITEAIDVTPPRETERQVDQWRNERDNKPTETAWEDVGLDENKLIAQGNAACKHLTLLEMWWKGLTPEQRGVLGAKGRGTGPYLPQWKEGQQVSKASRDDPAEPPAAVDVSAETPQAVGDKEDVFGLQQHPDEAFARTVIAAIEASATVAELDAARAKWSEGGDWHKRMSEIPEASWQDIMDRYRQKEDQLTGRSP